MGGAASKGLAKSGQGLGQRGQDAGADAVAGELLVRVAGVFHPRLALTLQPFAQCRAWHSQPRAVPGQALPVPVGGHAGQTGQACATRQGQQQGFDLVIGVLGQGDITHLRPFGLNGLGQRGITGLARSVFGALARSVTGLHPAHSQRHPQRQTQCLAMRLETIGSGLQAVVDVHRPHLSWPATGTGHEQRCGVGTATQSDGKRKARTETSQGLFGRGCPMRRHGESLRPRSGFHSRLICPLWCR